MSRQLPRRYSFERATQMACLDRGSRRSARALRNHRGHHGVRNGLRVRVAGGVGTRVHRGGADRGRVVRAPASSLRALREPARRPRPALVPEHARGVVERGGLQHRACLRMDRRRCAGVRRARVPFRSARPSRPGHRRRGRGRRRAVVSPDGAPRRQLSDAGGIHVMRRRLSGQRVHDRQCRAGVHREPAPAAARAAHACGPGGSDHAAGLAHGARHAPDATPARTRGDRGDGSARRCGCSA